VRVDEIGVGVVTAEIGKRFPVADRAGREAEAAFEDLGRIRPGDRAHRVERHRQFCRPDRVEVEQRFQERGVILDRVDDLDGHAAYCDFAVGIEVDVLCVDGQPTVDLKRPRVDRVGDALGRGAAIGDVVLDPEILVGTAGIVAGGQDQAADRATLADHVARGRRRQDAAAADDHPAEAVSRRHPDRDLDDFAVEEAAVAADDQCRAGLVRHHVEHALDEILGVVRLLEDLHFLA
jgi:hypothetical protein